MSEKKESALNLYQKLAFIRKSVEVMKKNAKGYGYNYTSEDEILAKITTGLDKYGVSLIPGINHGTISVVPYEYKKIKFDKTGKMYEEPVSEILITADTTWTWVNNEDPNEKIVVPWAMVGQQTDASQCFGSGLTYSSRYFLLKYFGVATVNDDPDNWKRLQEEAEKEADAVIAKQIAQSIDNYVQPYVKSHPDKREALGKLIIKFVSSGNYFEITNSKAAATLLNEIREKFPETEKEEDNA